MSAASDALARAEAEIASAPDVWFVLVCCDNKPLQPLYAVQLPQDLERFRLWDDPEGFDVMFKFRGRWRPTSMAWRQLKKLGLDPCEARPCSIVTFGRRILGKMGVKKWKPKR